MKKILLFALPIILLSGCELFEGNNNNDDDDFVCGETLVDERDNQTYATIQIGGECWMAENLNYGTYTESFFTNESHSDVSDDGVVEKYALDNETSNNTLYGGLYDWNELMDYSFAEGSRGICPEGWHVSTDEEWIDLEEAVGGVLVAGLELKEGGSSGFDIPLAGSRLSKGQFSGHGEASLWTSTPSASHPTSRAGNRNFIDGADNIQRNTDVMNTGKYCRCVKD